MSSHLSTSVGASKSNWVEQGKRKYLTLLMVLIFLYRYNLLCKRRGADALYVIAISREQIALRKLRLQVCKQKYITLMNRKAEGQVFVAGRQSAKVIAVSSHKLELISLTLSSLMSRELKHSVRDVA